MFVTKMVAIVACDNEWKDDAGRERWHRFDEKFEQDDVESTTVASFHEAAAAHFTGLGWSLGLNGVGHLCPHCKDKPGQEPYQ